MLSLEKKTWKRKMKTNTSAKIEALQYLSEYLTNLESDELKALYSIAYAENTWFTDISIKEALAGIRDEYLDQFKLTEWIAKYDIDANHPPKKIGLILAGNIPAVGFNDVLCVFLSNNVALIKYAEKDKKLIPFLLNKMTQKFPQFKSYFQEVEMLKEFDAVIATGSDNSGRYFQSYFGKYPNIIRKNRNSIAVLNGKETKQDILDLGKDIFSFFGLGCRNVSKLFLPEKYDLTFLLEQLHEFNDIIHHNKYKNNFDYNIALFLLNKVKYLNNGCIIILEDERYASRIASLHYEYYTDLATLADKLTSDENHIQCVVSHEILNPLRTFKFGKAQTPSLYDYADGIDTMLWLTSL